MNRNIRVHVFYVKFNHCYSVGHYSIYYRLRRVTSFIRSYIIYLMEIEKKKKDLFIMV